MLDRTIAPPIVDAVDFNIKLKPCVRFSLANDVPVYAINAGAEELVSVEWLFYAGNNFEQCNMIAASVNYLLKNGTAAKSAFDVNETFDFYGAYVNTACYNETASVMLTCLSKHLPQLLPLVRELITESIFPENEIAIYRQNQKQRLAINLKKSDFVAGRLIDAALFGAQHPYGKYTTVEDLDALSREDLLDFYRRFYTQGTCFIFIAGKLPVDVEQQLNRYFGDLPFSGHTPVTKKLTDYLHPAKEKIQVVVNDEKSVQGAIRIAHPFANRRSPDWQKMQVLNTVFGGYFGSRLMSNIRENKGYTYGIHSFLQNRIQESAFVISTEAGKNVCEATIAEVWTEAKKLREQLIGKEELQLVRNYMMGSILSSLDGPFHIINRWKSYVLNELDEQFFYDSMQTIKTVTPEDLRILANKYLLEEDFYQLTVF